MRIGFMYIKCAYSEFCFIVICYGASLLIFKKTVKSNKTLLLI